MNSSSATDISVLAQRYYTEQETALHRRIDTAFQFLFVFQWIFGILVAYFVSPLTWAGSESTTHIHLWFAVFLGGVILGFPFLYLLYKKGTSFSRYLTASSQILYGALLIHLMGGRIEAHFHIFGSLAFLAAYRDWRVFIPATLIVFADHLIRGIYWPQSIFGVIMASEWRWLEHGLWVLFEDAFLIYTTIYSEKDMRLIAQKTAHIEIHSQKIEKIVEEKTREIKEQQAKMIYNHNLATLGKMASGIVHEMNNPLAIISIHTTTIQKAKEKGTLTDEIIDSSTQSISKTVDRMIRIMKSLRELYIKKGNSKKESLSLRSLFDDLLHVFHEKYQDEGIDFKIDMNDQILDTKIFGERHQISQIFIQLLSNSYDAVVTNEKKWIKITGTEENDLVNIHFSDSGSGISSEIEGKIFDPFFSSKKVAQATGLGLTISKNLVEQNNGSIRYIPNQTHTCFEIKLPKSA